METYFVVLQLPLSGGQNSDDSNDDLIAAAAGSLRRGEASIVSIRKDTGVAEDVRNHVKTCAKFKTYVLLHIELSQDDLADKESILHKAAEGIASANYETVVDRDDTFQLIVAERIDVNNINVH